MLLPNHPSPGVYSMENDLATQIQAIRGGICTLVLPMPKGEVGVNRTVRSVDEIDLHFGPSVGPYANNVQIAKILMGRAAALNITPVGIGRKIASAYITSFNNLATCRPGPSGGFTDLSAIPFNGQDIGLITARSAYAGGNDIYFTFEPDVTDNLNIKFVLKVYEGDNRTPTETHVCTTKYFKDEAGNQFFVEEVVNESSNLIRFTLNQNNNRLLADPNTVLISTIGGGPRDPNNPTAINGQLTGGSDGQVIDINHPDEDIASSSMVAILEGWDNYRDWEDIQVGILCDGGITDPIIANKIDTLAQLRMDCIATHGIPVPYQSRDNSVAYRRGKKMWNDSEFTINGSWSSMSNSDVLARDYDNARNFYVPASVCAAYCMLTSDQIATWLAPAGMSRGKLDFALDVRHRFRLTDRDMLVDNQINPIALFEGEGIFMWGADTLYTNKSPLNDIGVRRLLSMLHATVRTNNLAPVFEPNDDLLRQQQRTSLEAILEPIRLGRGLDWYDVICDERNNPAIYEANGDMIIDVFLDPTRYTKRIHINAIVPPIGDVQFALDLIDQS